MFAPAIRLTPKRDRSLRTERDDGDASAWNDLLLRIRMKSHSRISVRVVVQEAVVGTVAQINFE